MNRTIQIPIHIIYVMSYEYGGLMQIYKNSGAKLLKFSKKGKNESRDAEAYPSTIRTQDSSLKVEGSFVTLFTGLH